MEIPSPAALVDLESVLRLRGHLPIRRGEMTQTLFPQERFADILSALGQFEFVKHFSPEFISPYFERFGRASFRRVAGRLVRDNRQWVPISDLDGIAGRATEDHLTFLERLQILDRDGDKVRLTRPINDLGASLEHYVAELCIRELRGAAEWGVILEGLPRAGGDYDVLAWLDPSLIYVECKSGHPDHISESSIREFFQRSIELAPDLAIFLVDTSTDLTRLIDGIMNPILREALNIDDPTSKIIEPLTDYPRASHGFQRFYVTNSNKTILAQLRRCLQHYYAHVKGVAHFAADEVNFIARPVRDET